jgi:hypothetical protein
VGIDRCYAWPSWDHTAGDAKGARSVLPSALGPRDHHLAIELARALMEHDALPEASEIFDRIRDEGGDGTPGWLVGFQVCNILTGNFGAFEDAMSSIRQLPKPQRRLVNAEIMDEVARISARWLELASEAPARADRDPTGTAR